VNVLEIFTFRAQFLPWFLVLFIVVFGFDAQDDLIGAVVGHLYYFLADVLPQIPETYKLQLIKAPRPLVQLCEYLRIHQYGMFDDPDLFGAGQGGAGGWFFVDDEDEQQIIQENPELFDQAQEAF